MIASRADAARRAEIRDAARGWRSAGAIDDATLARIEAIHPDERPRMALAWQVLVFVIVTIAANALFFGVAAFLHDDSGAAPWLLFAGLLAAATEFLLRGSGFGDNGSAAATSFWAAVYATVGVGFASPRHGDWQPTLTLALLAATVAFAGAAVRWGYAAEGAISVLSLYLFLGRFPFGRLAWIVAGLVLAAAAWPARERRGLALSFRRAAAAAFALSGLAFYAAVNRYSLEYRLVETLRAQSFRGPAAPPWLLVLSSLATAIVPAVLISWGLSRREMLPLDLGLLFAALSLATLRWYVRIGPLWAVLAAAGAALVLGALWVGRRLRTAPGGEWRGFTARPLYGTRGGGLESAAVVAAFAPDGRAPAPAEHGGMTPGGGGYGGGGASGSF